MKLPASHSLRVVVLTGFLLTLTLLGTFPIQAGLARSSSGVSVHDQSVVSEFPSGLRMTLVASAEEPVSRASIRIQVGDYPTYFETTTRFTATDEVDLELAVPLQLMGISTGVEIEYQWRLHTESGEVLETPLQTTDWIDNRFDWQTYQTDEVIVFAYGNDEELYQQTAQISQETANAYQEWLQAPERSEPIRIWLYDSQDDLHGALNPNSREWIGGVSYALFSLIAGVVPEDGEGTMLRIIPHEVIHQIIDDATANPFAIPAAWFDEGLAGYGQPVGTENFDEIVALALAEDRLPTVRSMMGEWASDPVAARTSYAASYSVVSFVIESMGEDAIPRLIEAYRSGLSHDDVILTALSMTPEELDLLWREQLLN